VCSLARHDGASLHPVRGQASGEFAFGCCIGQIRQTRSTEATSMDFSWSGHDEMEEVTDLLRSIYRRATGSPMLQ
jgi:hypothetical protein